MYEGILMFGNVVSLEGLHVTGKYRDRSMQRTYARVSEGVNSLESVSNNAFEF